MDNNTISPRQFMYLVILFLIGSSILIVPTPLAATAQQDGWISSIVGMSTGVLFVLLYHKLGVALGDRNFIQGSIHVFGNWIGRVIAFFHLSFIYILASLVLRNIGDFMTTQIMIDTPLQFTHILFMIVVILAARLGIEVVGRSAEMFITWIMLLLFFLFFFLTPQLEPNNIQPIFSSYPKSMIGASLTVINTPILEMVVLLMLYPNVKEKAKARHAWLWGLLIGGGLLSLITFFCILVLGSDLTALNSYPIYELASKINIAGFLEGIEIIVAIVWMLTIFFKLVILYYAAALGISQFLNLDDYRPLLLPLGMGLVVLSIIVYPDVAYFETFVKNVLPYKLMHGFLLPLLLLIGALIKKKRHPYKGTSKVK
ncbi:spore germination protein KB [Thalassobacillus cyri]|uniref:Spore germination protein KB n=1 Tax=Thalassobacillus cyri TaxID=571932 RepID=A0A1H4HHY9_9BACI|nr:endospore germination permease [Thalassobacillus cyri]SEB20648.1 spore germination protein KB [Thalassobacillus cyri]